MCKRDSGDVGWETAVIVDPSNANDVKCILSGQVTKPGINRHKVHIAGIKGKGVKPCLRASEDQKPKCREALKEKRSKKVEKLLNVARLKGDVIMSLSTHEEKEEEEEEISIIEGRTRKRHINVGTMDQFARPIKVDYASMSASKKMKQQNVKNVIFKKRLLEVHQYLARCVYEAGFPFNAIDNDSFKRFVEALGQYGPDYTPPSQYQLREPLLKGEVERTKEILKKQEEEWKNSGCSIMTNAWSDRKRKSIMNLCVNWKLGTTFVSLKEALDDAHTGQYIFNYVNKCIKDIGYENVVQIVTDNASNNMATANLLALEWSNIFWISCASHTINLMLEGISKLPSFKGVIDKAKSFTIFIYAHHKTLALMRKLTKKEIVRLGVTRIMFEVFTPLVKVLRLVDGEEKPSMGFVFGELLKAKDDIKKMLKKEGCDDDEHDDEMENDILPPKKDSRNVQVEMKEPEENDFVSNDTENELDEDVDVELKSDKKLDKS
nr:uncharacterized protein LOC125424192 [Ziziphus jujuba var. spinosa]